MSASLHSPHCHLFCSATSMTAGLRKSAQDCCDETLSSFCESLGMDVISFFTLSLDVSLKIGIECLSRGKIFGLYILYVCNCIIRKVFFKKEAAVTLEISPFSQFSLAPSSAGCRLRKTGDSVKIFYLYDSSSYLILSLRCWWDPCLLLKEACWGPHWSPTSPRVGTGRGKEDVK